MSVGSVTYLDESTVYCLQLIKVTVIDRERGDHSFHPEIMANFAVLSPSHRCQIQLVHHMCIQYMDVHFTTVYPSGRINR